MGGPASAALGKLRVCGGHAAAAQMDEASSCLREPQGGHAGVQRGPGGAVRIHVLG